MRGTQAKRIRRYHAKAAALGVGWNYKRMKRLFKMCSARGKNELTAWFEHMTEED